MGIMTALALLAGGVGGYTRGQEAKREEARQKEDDDFRREQRERTRIDWQRQDEQYNRDRAEQDAVKKAGAPTAVEEVPQLDLGDPEAAPTVSRFKAAGTMVDTRADADKAAADYNAAPARMRRAAGAISDPVRAGQLEASANTVEAGTMQMKAAKLKEADDAFNRDLMNSVTDFASLESFVNASKGDGQNGALQIKIVPNPDGKTVAVMKLGADGTMTPTPFNFPNTTEGVQQAVGIIGMRLPPEQKLAHLQAAAKTEEERRRWGLEFGLKEKDSVTRGKREDRMAAAAERQAAAAERAALARTGGSASNLPANSVPIKDIQATLNRVGDIVAKEFKIGADTITADTPEAKAAEQERVRAAETLTTTAQRLVMGAAQVGLPITGEIAVEAVRNGKIEQQQIRNPQTGELAIAAVINVGGNLIPLAITPATPEKIGGGRGKVNPPTIGRMAASAAVAQAGQKLAAAVQSGDPQAVLAYKQQLDQAIQGAR